MVEDEQSRLAPVELKNAELEATRLSPTAVSDVEEVACQRATVMQQYVSEAKRLSAMAAPIVLSYLCSFCIPLITVISVGRISAQDLAGAALGHMTWYPAKASYSLSLPLMPTYLSHCMHPLQLHSCLSPAASRAAQTRRVLQC